MKHLILVVLILPAFVYAQVKASPDMDTTIRGIRFISGLTWQQILANAADQKKYVFVDCFATWCGPCKLMERDVFPSESVGAAYNPRFICVKMQMDKSGSDDSATRLEYTDAKYVADKYQIQVYPTYLYISPAGKLIKEVIGAMDTVQFADLPDKVMKWEADYLTRLENCKTGTCNLEELRSLVTMAYSSMDTALAIQMQKKFFSLLKQGVKLTREDVVFLMGITKSTTAPGFKYLYENSRRLDRLMAQKLAVELALANVIYSEMVTPEIGKAEHSPGKTPDWRRVRKNIIQKYDSLYADINVLSGRSNLAASHKDWDKWSGYFIEYQEKYGAATADSNQWTAFNLNNAAWAVFSYSSDERALKAALSWSSRAILMDPDGGWIDTYANLLYKLGRAQLAIRWETIACNAAPKNKDIQESLAKMKKGAPTWTQQ